MKTGRWTDLAIRNLKSRPGKSLDDVPDPATPGMYLRINAKTGSKTWRCVTRINGKQVVLTMGTYPSMSLGDARAAFNDHRKQIKAGIDPRIERQRAKAEAEASARAAENTVEAVATEWVAKELQALSSQYLRDTRRILRNHVFSRWSGWHISKPTRRDSLALLEGVRDHGSNIVFDGVQKHLRGGRVAANHLWTVLNGLFAYALDHEVRGDNPMLGVKRPAKARSKDRVLDPEQELKWVLLAAKALPFPYGPFVTVLTFTGCRRGEALNMRWRDLNLDDGVWTQPRSKNGRMHTVTLTPIITEMLKTLPRKNEFVFFGGYGRGPFTNLAGLKRMLDAKIIELCGEQLEPWSLHDLRRSFATYVVPLGIDEFVVGKCLNHSSKTITGTTYSLWHYYDQKRHAWSVWSDRLVQLTEPPSSNVVKLQRA